MIHFKIISRILGLLLLIEALFMLTALGISIYYNEHIVSAYIYTIAATITGGTLLLYTGSGSDRNISRKDGYIVVSLAWIIFSIFGSLLYMLSGHIPSLSNAFFETISGFTTTGATILSAVEHLPRAIDQHIRRIDCASEGEGQKAVGGHGGDAGREILTPDVAAGVGQKAVKEQAGGALTHAAVGPLGVAR
jgi:hypothetical protein